MGARQFRGFPAPGDAARRAVPAGRGGAGGLRWARRRDDRRADGSRRDQPDRRAARSAGGAGGRAHRTVRAIVSLGGAQAATPLPAARCRSPGSGAAPVPACGLADHDRAVPGPGRGRARAHAHPGQVDGHDRAGIHWGQGNDDRTGQSATSGMATSPPARGGVHRVGRPSTGIAGHLGLRGWLE